MSVETNRIDGTWHHHSDGAPCTFLPATEDYGGAAMRSRSRGACGAGCVYSKLL